MNKILLWLAMLPAGLWRSMGADTVQLKAILTAKLTMDSRKPMAFGQSQKAGFTAQLMSIIASAVMGVLGAILILVVENAIVGMYCYFCIISILMMLFFLPEFPALLIDTRDNVVLFPRPVSDKTLVMSRLLHIFIFMLRTVIPLSLPGWAAVFYMHGVVSGAIFPVAMLLLSFIVLFVTNSFYLLVIRILSPVKLKKMMVYLQMLFTIGFMSIQLVLQKLSGGNKEEGYMFGDIDWNQHKWVLATPTYWLAAMWSWIGKDAPLKGTHYVAVLAFVAPILFLWITIKYLSPLFAQKLLVLAQSSDQQEVKTNANATRTQKSVPFSVRLARLFNRTPEGQAGFTLVWLQSNRSTTFRTKVFPSLAYPFIMFFVILFKKDSAESAGNVFFIAYIFVWLATMQIIVQFTHSDQFKAAWVYFKSPVARPGKIMAGGFKAVYIKFILPVTLLMCCLLWYKIPGTPYLDLVVFFVNITLSVVCLLMLGFRNLPFSIQVSENTSKMRTALLRVSGMIIVLILAGIHWLSMIHWSLSVIFLLLSSGFLWLVWDSYQNTSWDMLKKAEQ